MCTAYLRGSDISFIILNNVFFVFVFALYILYGRANISTCFEYFQNGMNFKAFLELQASAIGVAVSPFFSSCVYAWIKVSVEDRIVSLSSLLFINPKVCLESGVRLLVCLRPRSSENLLPAEDARGKARQGDQSETCVHGVREDRDLCPWCS